MKEELIKYLYSNTIELILGTFVEDEFELVAALYLTYLSDTYKDIEQSSISLERAKSIYGEREQKKWNNRTSIEKLSLLKKDDAFMKIKEMSSIAFSHARARELASISNDEYRVKITEEYANQIIMKMEQLLKVVQPFNLQAASMIVSESINDLLYALCKTDNKSFRNL